jgi:hypothetical protein
MSFVNASNISETTNLVFGDKTVVVEGKKDGEVIITAEVNADCERRGLTAVHDFVAALEDRGFHSARETAFAAVREATQENCPIAIRTPALTA